MGIVIILVMLATALLIVSRRLPTLVGMVGLAVLVALLGGAPWGELRACPAESSRAGRSCWQPR